MVKNNTFCMISEIDGLGLYGFRSLKACILILIVDLIHGFSIVYFKKVKKCCKYKKGYNITVDGIFFFV